MRTKVQVPATTANLGPGFDVVGMALCLYNEVEMEEIGSGLVITVEGEGAEQIPRDNSNLVYQAAEHIFRRSGYIVSGLRIHLKNRIPVTRGLGSSSAALVGGLVAANHLCGNPFDERELLRFAIEIEGHPDNVAPALLGGIVVSGRVRGEWRTVRLQPPDELQTVVAVPAFELPTRLAREVVPSHVSREDAIFTSSHVGLMMTALLQNDLELFGAVLEDRLHQPYREPLVPGLRKVLEQAERYGAVGAALSGAGPTVIAFTRGSKRRVGEMMELAFVSNGVACKMMHLTPGAQGCLVVEEAQETCIGVSAIAEQREKRSGEQMKHPVVKVGLLGLGTVGSGVVKFLRQQAEEMAEKSGYEVEVKKILVRDLLKKRRVDVPRELLTQNVWEIVQDPEIQIVIEVMGGERGTKEYVQAALEHGKHVVTANKDLIALHSPELYRVAESNGCELLYEAAVAGAIPIVRVMKQSFAADRIHEVMGIVNGTTNFILSKMTEEGAAYEEALREAQEHGYAEANPFADVSGLDAARKMAILASISFNAQIALSDVQVSGIADITLEDVLRAREQQAVIKLIGRARREECGHVTVEVKPTLLPVTHPLAGVSDCFNAVYVYGEALGEAMFYGRGAGEFPTASAVVGDLLAVLRGRKFAANTRLLPIANV